MRARITGQPFLLLATALPIIACGDDTAGLQATPGVTIIITPSSLVLGTGATATLEAVVQDAEGRPVSGREVQWSSSAPKIASVSPSGRVTALAVGRAMIGAYLDQSVGFASVIVQLSFILPVSVESDWFVLTEIGTLAPGCSRSEGGLRSDGTRDCSHSGLSRYSLDLADLDQWTGASPDPEAPEVVAAAEGTITDICIQPPTEATCGTNGPFVLVEHDGGFSTIYAHLDPASVTLRRKTPVGRGQPLGRMGQWGSDPAPWLHFELRYENQGAAAAPVLESLHIGGHKLRDYRAGFTRDSLRS
jgi:hypothetical protein